MSSGHSDPEGWLVAGLAQSITVVTPVVFEAFVPKYGYIVGGAVGGVASDAIAGDIHNWDDVVESAIFGAGGFMMGGAIGKKIARGVAERKIADIRRQSVFDSMGDSQKKHVRAVMNAKGNEFGGLVGTFLAHNALPLAKWAGRPSVPTEDIGAGVLLPGMPDQLLMPGPAVLAAPIEAAYRAAVPILVDSWRQCGTGKDIATTSRPHPPTMRKPKGTGIPQYELTALNTEAAIKSLHGADTQTTVLVRQTEQNSTVTRGAITRVIDYLNRTAPLSPDGGMTQDEWTSHHLQHAAEAIQTTIADAARNAQNISDRIGRLIQSA
ncbi:hypothetical protein F3087_26970 [Nocardia colli]|uniref:Uncharacterized protein n=1 Tax=Nocardia colli TaxID=2545717 RepID=A0A5N0EFP0_9NOCA|nr:hypothetical protein [Nocardia colli]KAA8886231.1 hypothetical protein F3087_26970 [Nocardia colli]